jgi:CubicO group peptidase (beta-lactamase class C family)
MGRTLRSARALFTALVVCAVMLPTAGTIACAQPTAATPAASAAIDLLTKRLTDDVARDDAGSITAAVVIGDSVVWAQGFGWADRDKRIVADRSTIYRIGSISKTFTAAVLAQLVDRKIIALDDPVERYFPEIKGLLRPRTGAAPITFRQLASHTAGIVREPALPGAASGPIAEWEAKVLASIPTTAFDTTPGARYAYSNIGYGMLGLALSRAAKVPFMQLVEDGIFRPLGMTSSTFIVTDRLRPQLSVGYVNGSSGLTTQGPAAEHLGRGYKVPNGGIYTTAPDLARFIAALTGAGTRIMSDSIRRAMLTKQTPGPAAGYGLGLSLSAPAGAVPTAGHGGSVAGYTCAMSFDPVSRIGVILLRNYSSGATSLDAVASQTVRALVAERKTP